MKDFRIPILNIQDKLLGIEANPEYRELKVFCDANVQKTNYFPGKTPDPYYKFEFELERQWYPVLVTNDRYLATKVMKRFVCNHE